MGGVSGSNNMVGSGGGGTASGGASGSQGNGILPEDGPLIVRPKGSGHGMGAPQYGSSGHSDVVNGSGDEELGSASGSESAEHAENIDTAGRGVSGSNLSEHSDEEQG